MFIKQPLVNWNILSFGPDIRVQSSVLGLMTLISNMAHASTHGARKPPGPIFQDEEPPEGNCRRYIPSPRTSPQLLKKLTPKLKRKPKPCLAPIHQTLFISIKHQSQTIPTGCCYRYKDSW